MAYTMNYDKNTAIRIRNFLLSQGLTIEGVYGMMANIYSESGFRSNNAQNSYMNKMGMTDESYTVKVDNGTYTNFVFDRVGYGLCQWTSSGRKQNLYNYAKSCNKSIGDETMQLNFLMKELNGSYKTVLNILKTSRNISECAKYVMTKFERPSDQSVMAQNKRANYGIQLFDELGAPNIKEEENIVTNINSNLEIRQCILVDNDCYKQHKKMTPSGIVVHSTGANNPNLKRYVQPDDGILGINPYNNHWNKSGVSKCVHAFIGKDANGIVRVYQTLPWDYCCWGCGSGKNGTYNNKYIQFEICEDALTDINYFNPAFNLASELCSYLVEKYNISTSNIVSHNEAYKRGYATGHADCDHWLNRHGKTMDWFRNQVSNKYGISTSVSVSPNISSSATKNQKVNVTYAVKTEDGKILPAVNNLDDYAGIENKKIIGLAMKVDKGTIKYQVHEVGGDWLPYVTGYNWNDHKNGYAGNGKPIDAVRVYYNTPSDLVTNGGYREAKYRVSPVGGVTYYDWQLDDTVNKAKGMDGYAGAFGKAIDKFQVCIE